MNTQAIMLILLAGGMLLLIAAATHFSGSGNLDNIKVSVKCTTAFTKG